jgi:hypothetical protein
MMTELDDINRAIDRAERAIDQALDRRDRKFFTQNCIARTRLVERRQEMLAEKLLVRST